MTVKQSKEGLAAVREAHKDDHYATPVSLAYTSLLFLQQTILRNTPRPILYDTGMGDFGVFGYAARKIWPEAMIIGDDLREVPHWPWYDMTIPCHDFTFDSLYDNFKRQAIIQPGAWHAPFPRPNAFIGNPPFRQAEAFVRRAMSELRSGYVFYLLRLAFAESDRREPFFNRYPHLACTVCRRRPSWWLYDTVHKGKRSTNSTAYAFYTWASGFEGTPAMDWLGWRYDERLEAEFKEAIGV